MIATLSEALSVSKYRAVSRATDEADALWCPPTFMPSGLARTLLAQCTIAQASHNTRFLTFLRTSSGPAICCISLTGSISGARPRFIFERVEAEPSGYHRT